MKFFQIIFLLFLSLHIHAQNIVGTISDNNGFIPYCNIVIKEKNDVIKQFTKTDIKGFFKIELESSKDSLFLEISSIAYQTRVVDLKTIKVINNTILINLILEKKINYLEEVVVTKQKITIDKDTTDYNPNAFRDGSEKVVEDLLKKLPGIKVANNGEITFKGKAIKKMLLDGDDLFDSNYKIGSKNISVDMIEKVQGIDNYEENSLLKGLKDSEDVAINLVLKKGKTDFSGNGVVGYGIDQRYYGVATGILINSKVKGFGISTFNNVGQNSSPYDFNGGVVSLENLKNNNINAKSIISEGDFNSILDGSFQNINNTVYNSLNTLQKVFTKSSFKINLGTYHDQIKRLNENNSKIIFQNQSFEINEINSLTKKPILYDGNLYFSNKEKNNFHWEYLGKFNYGTINLFDNSINNGLAQNNTTQSNRLLISQNLNSTYKFSENKALVTSFLFTKSRNPQSYYTNPGTTIDNSTMLIAENQQSEFQKQFLSVGSSLFISKNDFKYALHASITDTKNKLNSVLSNNQNQSLGNQFENSNHYNIQNFMLQPIVIWNTPKYMFKAGCKAVYNNVLFKDSNFNINENSLFLLPKFSTIYTFNTKNSTTFTYEFEQNLPDENRLFQGIIQSSNRQFVSNQISVQFLKSHSYSLAYNFSDLFNNSQLGISLNHNFRPNNYFNNTLINSNITISNQFFAKIASKNYGFKINGEKYFHPLRTTFTIESSFNLYLDNNIVNGSELRAINGENLTINFAVKRGIKKWMVIENKMFFLQNKIKVAGQTNSNKFEMLTNLTKIIFRPKNNINSSIIGNFVNPDLKSNQNYYFLDFEIDCTTKNKKITYSLVGKNLTNYKFFTTKNVGDFFISTSSHNLIERYVMMKMAFNF